MFCFSEKQREALELVALIEHFMKRGTLETVPEWIMRYHRDRRKIVFDELSAALYP
jgi:hypothetical protein